MTTVLSLIRRVRGLWYCQNPRCAGQATYAAHCCGMPMVAQ